MGSGGFCPCRAAEWQLDQPSWSGRLRITAKGQVAYIKLEDRTSGKGWGEGLRPGLCLMEGTAQTCTGGLQAGALAGLHSAG